jgi:hypothetical protein
VECLETENNRITRSLVACQGETDGLKIALTAAESRRREQEELLQVSVTGSV